MSESTEQTISSDALEKLTGLTDRRHRQIAKDGWFPPPINGVYKLSVTIRGLFKYYHEVQETKKIVWEERRRLTKEQADAIEIANKHSREELVDVSEFKQDYARVYVELVRLVRESGLTDERQDALLQAMAGLHK